MSRIIVDFDILSEPWNRYQLSDGSTLRNRFCLLKVVAQENKDGTRLGIVPNLLLVVDANPALHGPPGPKPSQRDLEKNSLPDEIVARALSVNPSRYRLTNGFSIEAHVSIVKVSRTSLFGPDGEPIYHTETEISTVIVPSPDQSIPVFDAALREGLSNAGAANLR